MFDQRELSLPVERTFQNQRPGVSSRLAPRDAHVHRLHLGGEAPVARDPQVIALGALGLVPAERHLRACARPSAERARPASARAGASAASAGTATASTASASASGVATARSRVEENLPIPLHIDSGMCRSLPRAGGRRILERQWSRPGPDRAGAVVVVRAEAAHLRQRQALAREEPEAEADAERDLDHLEADREGDRVREVDG